MEEEDGILMISNYICKACGKKFKPKGIYQIFCTRKCYIGFYNKTKKNKSGYTILKFFSENLDCSKKDFYNQFPNNSKNHLGRYFNLLQKIKEDLIK